MDFSISGFKAFATNHDGEKGWSLMLALNGKPFAKASYDGWGGPIHYENANVAITSAEFIAQIKSINAELGKTKIAFEGFELPNSIDLIVGEKITEVQAEKAYDKTIKRLGYVKDAQIFLYSTKFKPDPDSIAELKSAPFWTSDCRVLQEVPKAEILALL